jgi:hypothetical protein
MKITKLPLLDFLELLNELYESGIDYIDMDNSKEEGEENVIEITIEEGYMMKEEENENIEDVAKVKAKFIDNDINDLI